MKRQTNEKVKTRRRTPAQKALIELRRRLSLTQAMLASHLNVSSVTAARWETSLPPRGIVLAALHRLAYENGHGDLAAVFAGELDRLKTRSPGEAALIEQEKLQWAEISYRIAEIETEANALVESGNPAGKAIKDHCRELWIAREKAQLLSWRYR